MKLPRRQFLHLAAGAAALPAVSRIAWAQAYPTRPVRVIVGFPAGGGSDIAARLIGQWLQERLGQAFIVENRPGSGTNLAAEAVVRAASDGYTLLFITAANAINATLYDNLRFNLIHDIAPVAGLIRNAFVMTVNPSFPARTVPEFIAYAKANPGKISMASNGIGGGPHVSGELFKYMAGVDMIHVPYRGDAPAITDLLGGQVQVFFATLASAIENIKAGRLRAMSVTTSARQEALPDVPAMSEFVPGYEASGWWGIGAPRDTPVEIINTLAREINAALGDPKMKARISELGGVPTPTPPGEFRKFIAADTEKWGRVIRAAGIKAE
jgi:tripartite-type tricarboxylate transporter receptor subunit TctC